MKKYKTLPGGLTCKEVLHNTEEMPADQFYETFEASNPPIPLTEVMPEGVEFSGSEVWQVNVSDHWNDINKSEVDYYEGHGYPTQLAIKPLKAKEPVKICPTCKKGKEFQFCSNAFHIIPYVDEPILDVVENKETVEQAFERLYPNHVGNRPLASDPMYQYYRKHDFEKFKEGANWQQSHPIEGIVGFVLEWVANNAKSNGGWLDYKNEIVGSVDREHIRSMKSDIIKEYNNGK